MTSSRDQFWFDKNCKALARQVEGKVEGLITLMEGYESRNGSSPGFDLTKPCIYAFIKPNINQDLIIKEISEILTTTLSHEYSKLPIRSVVIS